MITPTLIQNVRRPELTTLHHELTSSQLAWKGYLIFMALNLSFIPFIYFCYPETSNLTLEEIDFLFTKDGNTGLRKFGRRSQPVQESLKPNEQIQREIDVEKAGGTFSGGQVDHVDKIDDKAS